MLILPWWSSAMPKFTELETYAAKIGLTLLPLPREEEVRDEVVISQAGELIHSGTEERKMLLDPIIREGYLVWLYAPAKTGKSWVALAIAHAVALPSGVLGKWTSPDPHGVFFVDGEMLADELQQSIDKVMVGAGGRAGELSFSMICAKKQAAGYIDIADETWQVEIENALTGKKLLVIDNIQSLTKNNVNVIVELLPWFRKITARNVAILCVDHTNREGELQGSMIKERIANLSISLEAQEGAPRGSKHLLVDFPVARRLKDEDAEPFILEMTFEDDAVTFSVEGAGYTEEEDLTSIPDSKKKRLEKMAKVVFARRKNLTFLDIQKTYDIPNSSASNYFDAAQKLVGKEKKYLDAEVARLEKESPTE